VLQIRPAEFEILTSYSDGNFQQTGIELKEFGLAG
jgi:hypothetical protein